MNHSSTCLICNVNKPVGRLENWSYKEGDLLVWGNVYDDTKGRFEDGSYIHTSQIVHLDIEGGHVRTLNSLYLLGKRKQLDGVKA